MAELTNPGAYEIEIPLLVLLFRAFNCWDTMYYDMIVNGAYACRVIVRVTRLPFIYCSQYDYRLHTTAKDKIKTTTQMVIGLKVDASKGEQGPIERKSIESG